MQGIHNVFIVIPQFLVTGLSSIVFAIFDPQKVVVPHRPVNNGTTIPDSVPSALRNASDALSDTILKRTELFENLNARNAAEVQSSSSIVYIFRYVVALSPRRMVSNSSVADLEALQP